MDIPLNAVESSNIEAIGFDKPSGTIRVQFKNGGIYDYHNADEELFQALSDSPSKGNYVKNILRPGLAASKVSPGGK